MKTEIIPFSTPLTGEISVPGDKSISHRALITSSISSSEVVIKNFLPSDDCLSTLSAVRALGVEVASESESDLTVLGKGLHGLVEPENIIDAGNSGTTMRLLSGVLSGQPFFSVMTGDDSLRKRPMKRVSEPLRKMGSLIMGRKHGELPPLAIKGGKLLGIEYDIDVASAQVKSCLLLAGLYAEGETTVIEPHPTRDHTEKMLLQFGADLRIEERAITIVPGAELVSNAVVVPGDFSSAAFLIAAALLLRGSRVEITNVGLNPTRTGFLKVVEKMGAKFEMIDERFAGLEPLGNLIVSDSDLGGVEIDPDIVPLCIDELPILAVLATQAEGKTTVTEAAELRVKESDRIEAMCRELGKMGAKIEPISDGFFVEGPTELIGAELNSRGDHRVALALAVAAVIASSPSTIDNFECAKVSYPNFLEDLQKLANR